MAKFRGKPECQLCFDEEGSYACVRPSHSASKAKNAIPGVLGDAIADHISANALRPRPVVNPDQEVWIRERIETAMRMALALQAQKGTRADDPSLQAGLRGVAEGTAVEIIHTLDLEPGYVNLRRIVSQ